MTPATATIGDTVTYDVLVTLPRVLRLYDVTIKDVLPDSIDFDGYVSATCQSGCPLVNPINTYTPAAGRRRHDDHRLGPRRHRDAARDRRRS